MELNEFINLIANVGFPVAVTSYVLIRLEKQLSNLSVSFNDINASIKALISTNALK